MLRTFYWFRKIVGIAGCKPSEIPDRFVLDLAKPRLHLYAVGRRQPAPETLAAFERAHTLKEPAAKPFAGTKELFLSGPEGAELWKVLGGEIEPCRAVLDGFYEEEFGRSGLVNSTFDQKVSYLWECLLHLEQIGESKEHLSPMRIDDFAYPLDLKAALTVEPELLNHPLLNNFLSGQKYPMEDLVAGMALRTVAYADKKNFKEADYIWLGVVRILLEKMPEISEELLAWFMKDIDEKNKNLFHK